MKNRLLIATFAEHKDDLVCACRLIKSLRQFGGEFAAVPVWVCIPRHRESALVFDDVERVANRIVNSETPEDLQWLFYAGKPCAAAEVEAQAVDFDIIAWLDNDTIFLGEPWEFNLAPDTSAAYRPVMHNRAGSLWDQPPDPYWNRIYQLEGLSDQQLFPMESQADRQKIRTFFQAGSLIVRPQRGILHRWRESMMRLGRDSELAEMCRSDRNRWVFLHQAALVGAMIHSIERAEMRELTECYNYPVLFDRQYAALMPFNSIENVVTLRCVISFRALGSEWPNLLVGDGDKVEWLKSELGGEA